MGTAIVTATTRPEMITAHGEIGTWIQQRRKGITEELATAREALERAKQRKWATESLAKLVRSLEKHDVFLAKVCGAVDAGYSIVPNFQFDPLAVRTDSDVPTWKQSYNKPVIGAAKLPAGRGEYVSPEPEFTSWETEVERPGQAKRTVTIFRATEHAPVAVPFALMKRDLADRLHEALQEKFFDEIGIVRDTPRGDPVLVGRVSHPKKTPSRWDARGVTFFIGWWFDVRVLEP